MAVDEKDIIGSGLVFPLNIDSNGGVRPETGKSLIESSLRNIFATPNNKRYFLGEFKCRIQELLHEPNDTATLSLVQTFLLESISIWEPRIELIGMEFSQTDTKIIITLSYRIKGTQVEEAFVFPFYTEIRY